MVPLDVIPVYSRETSPKKSNRSKNSASNPYLQPPTVSQSVLVTRTVECEQIYNSSSRKVVVEENDYDSTPKPLKGAPQQMEESTKSRSPAKKARK